MKRARSGICNRPENLWIEPRLTDTGELREETHVPGFGQERGTVNQNAKGTNAGNEGNVVVSIYKDANEQLKELHIMSRKRRDCQLNKTDNRLHSQDSQLLRDQLGLDLHAQSALPTPNENIAGPNGF